MNPIVRETRFRFGAACVVLAFAAPAFAASLDPSAPSSAPAASAGASPPASSSPERPLASEAPPSLALPSPAAAAPSSAPAADSTTSQPGVLELQVVDATTGDPVPFPNLVLLDSRRGFLGSEFGTFRLELSPGLHRMRVMHVSYEASAEFDEQVTSSQTTRDILALEPHELMLPPVEVTAQAAPSARISSSGVRALDPQKLAAMPNVRDDPFQMLRVLPGVAGDDVGAEFHLRGGSIRQTLVRIDGMEVRELFHGRDFGGITGIVPLGLVDGMDVYLGGFPAEYGGRVSGVVDLDLRRAGKSGAHGQVGIDAVSARTLAEVHGEKSSTFLSVREGYLDRVLEWVQDEAVIQPAYRDLMLRSVLRRNESEDLSWNYIRSEDHLFFDDDVERHYVDADYLDHYLWSTWKHAGSSRVVSSATVYGALSKQLRSVGFDGRDDHNLTRVGGRLDLDIQASDIHLLKTGAQFEREGGRLSIRTDEIIEIDADGIIHAETNFEGEKSLERFRSSAYVQDSIRPYESLALGLGLRVSHDDASGEVRWNPRTSFAWNFAEGWTATGAWGKYDQPPDVQLSDEPGLRLVSDRAAWAEHVVAGIKKSFGRTTLGVEAYAKDFHRLDGVAKRTIAGNTEYYLISRGGASGLEMSFEHVSRGSSFWLSYTVAKSEWGNVDHSFLRDFDQRHALTASNTIHFGGSWDLGTTYVFHSGRPYTVESYRKDSSQGAWLLTEGPVNGSRLPQYHRVDLRLRRNFQFDGWNMGIYAEGLNLTNHENVLWYSWGFEPDPFGVRPVKSERTGMPALPTLGIEINF